jgi:serine/threonine protein kinase
LVASKQYGVEHHLKLLLTCANSLDFSVSSVSTIASPPTPSTRRYSAPEVFESEPRNRSTDIWGLGCVLIEILSRLRGYKLDALKISGFREGPMRTVSLEMDKLLQPGSRSSPRP